MATSKLYIGNLSFKATEEDLRTAFGSLGTVTDVYMALDKKTGRPRGFAFVTMGSVAEAQAAVAHFNGVDFLGRPITVTEARPINEPPKNKAAASRARDSDLSSQTADTMQTSDDVNKSALSLIEGASFTVWIDPGTATHTDIKDLFSALSDLSESLGGRRLIFARDHAQKPVVLVPEL